MSEQGEKVARKLELLLEHFPHPSGRPWRGSEIEAETNGLVSQGYFSSLRNGKFKRPGLEQLAAIADVMGFPFDLWRAEPEQWPGVMEEKRSVGRRAGDAEVVAEKFEVLCGAVMNPRTNRPFTDAEIVERSQGRLSAGDVAMIRTRRAGELTYDQLLALSDVFDVSFDYWFEAAPGTPLLNAELVEALKEEANVLLLQRTRGLSRAHKDMLLILAEQLQALEEG